MFKYLIPFLLVSTMAMAGPDKAVKPSKEALGPIISQNINPNKCSKTPEEAKEMIKLFKESGYNAMLFFKDKNKDNTLRDILYNNETDEILIVSLVFDKNVEDENTNIQKVCAEFIGNEPFGMGATMKEFIIHQHIDDMNKTEDKKQQDLKDERQKDGEVAPQFGDHL